MDPFCSHPRIGAMLHLWNQIVFSRLKLKKKIIAAFPALKIKLSHLAQLMFYLFQNNSSKIFEQSYFSWRLESRPSAHPDHSMTRKCICPWGTENSLQGFALCTQHLLVMSSLVSPDAPAPDLSCLSRRRQVLQPLHQTGVQSWRQRPVCLQFNRIL